MPACDYHGIDKCLSCALEDITKRHGEALKKLQETDISENNSQQSQIELDDIGRCLGCWFFICRCKEGLSKK